MEFRLLGPVEVRRDGQPLPLGGPRQRAVLAALALRANEVVSVDQLISAVWDRVPASPSSNIRTYVRQLRQLLDGPDAGAARLLTRTPGYQLTVHPGELDVEVFEELTDRGVTALARDDLTAGVAYLDRALRLWRGDPLAGLQPGPALAAEAVRLAERRLSAVEHLAQMRIRLGDYAEAVGELRRLVVSHPLREGLWAQLLLALYRGGRQAEALDAYQQVRRLLVTELGVEPGQELRRLHRAIVSDDLEHLFRPAADEPASAPDPREPALSPHRQLPMDIAEFTGRAAELRRLHTLAASTLADPGGAGGGTGTVCAIVGSAGIGKTRLAVHAAHQLDADTVLYADLAGFTAGRTPLPPDTVLERLLRALGVAAERIPDDLDGRTTLYRDRLRDQRVVLLLDNAADTNQVRPLLPGSPGAFVLVTSRRSLAWLDGVHMVRLDMFTTDEAVALLARIAGRERIAADRAAARRVVELCGRLPAAVAVAGRRLETRTAWTPADLAARLDPADQRLTELTAGPLDIRAMFHLSYQGLPADQRRMFRLLALHPGPDATASSAAALAGIGPEYADLLLESLLDEHLIQQTRRGRYRLHDLLRGYAGEQARADESGAERDAATRRALTWYLHTAGRAGRLIDPDRRLPDLDPSSAPRYGLAVDSYEAALGWFEDEYQNLVAAVRLAAEHGLDDIACQLPGVTLPYFDLAGVWDDWITANLIALGAAERIGDPIAVADAVDRLGVAYTRAGRHAEAAAHHQRALSLRRAAHDPAGQARTLHWLGAAYQGMGRRAKAVESLRLALLLFRINVDRRGEHLTLVRLADVLRAPETPTGAGRGSLARSAPRPI
ncbi:AfsR/SARP family transcriptional regulator [Phytohabitans suffuscus]|uniref:SARP family transcriptional regulator n=1 Tax=Phytohabitans suffuscus TaxID=624315 RepID=A0A6F8Z0R6_9ACTN|nr:AfsR/SARP family transcriptional regulator [Phytohabitans suffuscus]BCB91942.1 SARP family transcriptional regulator [Phytohabitans suffuscus]